MPGDKSNCLINDTATTEDSLGFKPYVEAIAEFLTNKGTSAPITLSIEGQWGCGKSSFMKQLKKQIEMRNLSKVEIGIFLKYLISKSEKSVSNEEVSNKLNLLIEILTESFTSNNKLILFIDILMESFTLNRHSANVPKNKIIFIKESTVY